MSLRSPLRLARWGTISLFQVTPTNCYTLPKIWTRGAKRTTTIKANALPQGALPPLPKDESEPAPEKQWPTVLQQHLNNVRKFSDCVVLTRVGDFYEMYFDQVEQYAPLMNLKKAKRNTVLGPVSMAGFKHDHLDKYLKVLVQDLGKQVAISEQIRLPDREGMGNSSGPLYDRKVTRVVTAGTLIDENFMDPFENNYLLAVHLVGNLAKRPEQSGRFEQYRRSTKVGLSWVDLSSGDFYTQESDLASLLSLVARIGPREIVMDSTMEDAAANHLQKLLGEGMYSLHFQKAGPLKPVGEWTSMLERPVSVDEQSAFSSSETAAGSLVLDYISERLLDVNIQLQPPIRRTDDEYMVIDKQSLRGLEIRSTIRDGLLKGSLLHTLRRTVTKSGARLLSQRIVSPSMSLSVINHRLDLVQELVHQDALREDITALLQSTFDTSRLLQRFSIGKGDADDLLSLARTINAMQRVSKILHDHIITNQERSTQTIADKDSDHPLLPDLDFLWDILGRLDLDGPAKVGKKILETIDEEGLSRQHEVEDERAVETGEMVQEVVDADIAGKEAPKLGRRASKQSANSSSAAENSSGDDIWIMRKNASSTLNRAHNDLEKLLQAKHELATEIRKSLKTESLTLKWSAQLGHYCHIKGKDMQNNLATLPHARTIGSTKSTRSFYLSDWTHLGVRIDDAKLRIRTEEVRVFNLLRGQVLEHLMRLRRNAAVLDELDVACSSAIIAKERNLVRPILHSEPTHHIIGGRHPTVDVGLREQGRQFTANDCQVGSSSNNITSSSSSSINERIYLITGPNMAGKSTYLRQNALITILAQTGLFVPASYASLGLVDKIFSRVGSADNLYQDQSTFMVEMLETAEILKQATPRSFVIMDEVGRGTTPEDGVAVGYACLHHLHNLNRSRTLFATHFHKLADMTRDLEGLGRWCTDVVEEGDGSWAYVHKLRRGVNRNSHALKVARLAGLPDEAIVVAGEVLADLRRASRMAGSGDGLRTQMRQSAAAG